MVASSVDSHLARKFENPPSRNWIRTDFPRAMNVWDKNLITETIDKELEKCGVRFKDATRINVAWPHKHPDTGYKDNAIEAVEIFQDHMGLVLPWISWVKADAIYEHKKLNRSCDQSSLHALTQRQTYSVDTSLQQEFSPFFDRGQPKNNEFFVLVDHCIEQGTTMANLKDFIEYNGGRVLAVLVSGFIYNEGRLAQVSSSDPDRFSLMAGLGESADKAGAIPEIAHAFAKAAMGKGYQVLEKSRSREMSAQKIKVKSSCLQAFEKALKPYGNSLLSLTDSECRRLISTVSKPKSANGRNPYGSLLGKLARGSRSPSIT